MGQKYPLRVQENQQVGPDRLEPLQWAEIAGLIDISPDGSWQPTREGAAWLNRLRKDEKFASDSFWQRSE